MDALKFTLEQYIQQRDTGMPKLNLEIAKADVPSPVLQEPPKMPKVGDGLKESAKSLFSGAWKPAKEKDNLAGEGEPLDASFRNETEYKKMLDFLRGKGTKEVLNPMPPKEAPKGWFVAEGSGKGVWSGGTWTQDESKFSQAVIDSEKAANELARVLGGIAIPAEEILG